MYAFQANEEHDGLEVVRLLLRHSPEVQVQQVSAQLAYALFLASHKAWMSVMMELLKYCPARQLAVPCVSAKPPLWHAVFAADTKLLQEMLKHITDPAVLAAGLMGVTNIP